MIQREYHQPTFSAGSVTVCRANSSKLLHNKTPSLKHFPELQICLCARDCMYSPLNIGEIVHNGVSTCKGAQCDQYTLAPAIDLR